jgi:predicted DNA binding CopG/RHH family protein
MKVELLHIADCPNREAARRLLKETLREFGLPEEISEIEVSDPAQAEVLSFAGSPTIRVNDKDVETVLPRQNNYGLSCRTYMIGGRLQGLPTQEMIRNAIGSALSLADREAKRS